MKNVQRLRTIKHPYVVSFLDSLETEEALILVTEAVTPIDIWLKQLVKDLNMSPTNLIQELTWGFKCILKALDFLHSQGGLFHGNLGLQSIFISQNGDWKLSSFELACNPNNIEDVNHFVSNHFILENSMISPERNGLRPGDSSKIDLALKSKVPPFYIDMYSFGQCMQKAFRLVGAELSGSLEKYIALTVSPDMKKRPTAAKLLGTASFNSDYIKILENVQEFSVKGPKEILDAIKELDPLLPQMTTAICTHKLLPNVCRVLQIAVNDYQNRDARESCRGVRISSPKGVALFQRLL